MITLGNITHSVPSVASKAAHALRDTGRMAVFVGTTGHAVAIGYGEAEYNWQVRRQGRYLVGVYDDDLAENEGFRAQLIADIRDRVQGWTVRGRRLKA